MLLNLRDDRGVIGILVGVLVGAVAFGVAALALDVGQLFSERAQLQNGADAAALAVAKLCVTSGCAASTAMTTALTYAGDNSADGVSAVDQVCGSGALGACSASTGAMTGCPAVPASGNYVQVNTSTKTSGGATVIAPVFGKALLGNDSYAGTTVKACSQAEWGGPSSATVAAFAISACEWDTATGQGGVFAQQPPAVPPASYDQLIQLTNGAGAGCATEPSGSDGAGNFGWADDAGSCTITITSGTFQGNPGASIDSACKSVFAADWASRSVIYLPVYTTISSTGSNAVYTLKGFAAFVLTGYKLPGAANPDWLNPTNLNSCSNKCITGYFTQGLIPDAGSPGGTYLGAAVVRITG